MTGLCACLTGWLFVERLGGLSDPFAIDAVLWSPLGASLAMLVFGGAVLAFLPQHRAALAGAIALSVCFGVVGHSATLGLVSSVTVVIHASAAAWWLGGLVLLLSADGRSTTADYAALVGRFSRQAAGIVLILVVAATTTAGLLLEWRFDAGRLYDAGLATKACLTVGLLVVAAGNRFLLLPRLADAGPARRLLRAAIIFEILGTVAIVATTAWLTSTQSPHTESHTAAPLAEPVGSIAIIDAWAPASVSGLGSGAGYLTIVNNQPTDDRLLRATSPWAEAVTLHRSQTDAGITRMRNLAELPLPAKDRVTLSPGGYHLMFTGLYARFVAGDAVPVTLEFERAGSIQLMMTVRPLGGGEHSVH